VAQAGTVRNPPAVDRLCQELFLSTRARHRDDNLLFVRERMLRSEVDTPGLLTVYERILDGKAVRDDETNPLISVLRLSGITRVENGILKVRSRVYREVFNYDWVNSNMPGAELRRQRAAYKRGLKRALAITLPLLLLGMLIAYGNLYLARNTIAPRQFKSPSPPAFWASSRIPIAGEQSHIGGILLRTGQPDVTVLVDDIQFGRTSRSGDLRIPLPPASYGIRLEKPGFRPIATPVLVAKNSETPVSVKLEREVAPSYVVTGAVPGATVRIDGREVGVVQPDGTFKHEGSPGLHTIELEKTGYRSVSGNVELAIGSTTSIGFKMQPDAETADAADYAAVADSTDPSALMQYLQKYPNSKRTAQVLARLEDLDWKKVNRMDLQSLDAFLKAYPQGPHTNEAQHLVDELQNEQADYVAALKVGSTEALQAFLSRHPNSPYAEQVRQKLSQQLDKEAVLSVLRRYEESYNRKDLEGIVDIWPSCPERVKKAYRDSFRSADPQKLKLEVGEPEIRGNFASVTGKGTRSGALNASSPFTATLVRQGDKWVIQSGIF
jgi:hypothetical protein